ncbi:manganese efflux pump MntP family protein [Bacillaceae bacterium CLA-AA-H227]|uniref:Manganese efflux pump MntP family protein n=1 Tax=Robertmurraya yapensis (ex Hitch et al 2024) TaxID=3133160 RepID=A0ACC6SHV1_9BACI
MSEFIGEMITLNIMAFALGMDAFSVGLGIGMVRIRMRQIFKIGIMIGLFHVLMPMIGMLAGRFLSERFGDIAAFLGGGLLLLLGMQMIWSSFKEDDRKLMAPVGFGLLLFSISVSLDSFSVGLSLGIYGAKTALVLICFGVCACVLTWLGLLLGRKVQGWIGTYSEALGGGILMAFGIKLLLL